VLACVLHYERAEWDGLGDIGLAHDVVARTYLDALDWAQARTSELYLGSLAAE
jgi:hypothetical protein